MPESDYQRLPFEEQIRFFQQKIELPTRRWDDIWQGMHARAFVVAGATKAELLADLRGAIDKAISQGTTLAEFRKDFDGIVQRHGWSYRGGRGWRTRVMLETNIRTSYAAGRFEQLKAVKATRPYLVYRHGDSIVPRPRHLAWDGVVLPQDDPWWQNHYPPNGWGCKCKVFSASERDLARMGKDGPDTAPDDGTYTWTDKAGRTHTIPNGIDPGWDYHVGEAAHGRGLSEQVMDEWRAKGAAAWERLTPGNWESLGRPATIPLDRPVAKPGPKAADAAGMEARLREILGGPGRVYGFESGGFRHDVHVVAATLARHVDPARSDFLPFLPEVLERPFEVWMAFERHRGTGQVVLRQRMVKAVRIGRGQPLLLVAQAIRGRLEAWTFVEPRNPAYLNRQRVGRLIWKREE